MLNIKKFTLILAGKAYNCLRLSRPKITILGYHSISSSDTLVDITPKAFRAQIRYLLSHGYTFISLREAINVMKGEKTIDTPSVVLTFDDGYHDLLDQVVPMLEKKHIPATYFIISDWSSVNRAKIENNKQIMNSNDVSKLAKFKHASVQCHTNSHIDLSTSSLATTTTEIAVSKTKLNKLTRNNISFFAFPWGRYNATTLKILKKLGFEAALTTNAGFPNGRTNVYELPRIMIDRTHDIEMFKSMLTPIYPYFFKLKKLSQFEKPFMTSLPLRPVYQLVITLISYIASRDRVLEKFS